MTDNGKWLLKSVFETETWSKQSILAERPVRIGKISLTADQLCELHRVRPIVLVGGLAQ